MKELELLLQKQLDLYSALLDIEKNKVDILVKGDVTELDRIVRQEQSYLMLASNLEKQRTQLLRGTPYEGQTMRQIIDELGENEQALTLGEHYIRLNEIVRQLKQVNFTNQKLLRTRLGVIDQVYRKFGVVQDAALYSNSR